MNEEFGLLNRSRVAIVTIMIIFLTLLISTTLLSELPVIPSSSTHTGLAYGADTGVGVTTNSSFAKNNSSQIKSTSLTGTRSDSNIKTLQYITNVRQLLKQTVDIYQRQNYTGALALATKAYLDNFEFVEGPLQQHDKTLKQNTEFMMRGDLREQIKHKVPVDDIKTLIGKINTNLDKAEKLLSST
jgi:hypothetical protein